MTATASPILVSGLELVTTTAIESAVAKRDELLALAQRGKIVVTPDSAERAALILRDITAYLNYIELGRKSAKAPVLEQGKMIDSLADSLTSALAAEKARIGGLVATFNAEQKRLAEVARQEAWEKEQAVIRENQRIQREADEKARKEQAERDRKAREEQAALEAKAAKAAEFGSAEALAKAQAALAAQQAEKAKQDAEAARARAAADEARDKAAFEAQAKAKAAALAVYAATTTGISTRREVVFEVTDITALYESAPYLVLLSPNNSAIKAALKNIPEGKSLPGIKHHYEDRAVVRA
jgi:hypothetical protein